MPANDQTAGKRLVLVVDDEALVRMRAVDMVEEAGFATIEASNSDEAMAKLQDRDDIAILVTDIDMPAGSMNGLRLAANVRDRWPHIEILIVSGRYRATAADLPSRAAFLGKPYSQKDLMAFLLSTDA